MWFTGLSVILSVTVDERLDAKMFAAYHTE